MALHRPVVVLLVAGLAAAGAALTGAGPVTAAPGDEVARLVVATSTVTAPRNRQFGDISFSTGVHLASPAGPLEFRLERSPYDTPVTATLTSGTGADRRTVTLPAGLSRDVNLLTGFSQVTVRDSRGRRVLRETVDLCPGGWDSGAAVRQDPQAPAVNPYQTQCGSHPFARGALLGIQDRWAVPLADGISFTAPPGDYTAEVLVTPRYRAALGLTKQQATARVKVRARNSNDYYGERTGPRATHDHHTTENGVPVVKTSLRAAARRPTPRAGDGARAVASGIAPNLIALPAFDLVLSRSRGRTYLNFSATLWNAGTSPLLVDGFRRPGTGLMDAYQYFLDKDGNQTGSAPAGTLQWDPRKGHHHWHFTAFASYRLLDADRRLAVRSGKEAFCLISTDPIDTTVPDANLNPESTTLQGACGDEEDLGTRQVIDVGWADTYQQDLPGQSFDVTTVPNGTYYVRVIANPDGRLTETTRADNGSLRRVKLGGTPGGRRTLKVTPYQGVTR